MRRLLSQTRYSDAPAGSPLARRLRRLSPLERKEEARTFLEAFHDACNAGRDQRQARRAEVRRQLSRSGSYMHTPEELAFGARLAWRNTGRCIGRLFWESLDVIDCRHIVEPDAIQAQILRHMDDAFSDGRIRSIISIFAPRLVTRCPHGSKARRSRNMPATKWLMASFWVTGKTSRPPGSPHRWAGGHQTLPAGLTCCLICYAMPLIAAISVNCQTVPCARLQSAIHNTRPSRPWG